MSDYQSDDENVDDENVDYENDVPEDEDAKEENTLKILLATDIHLGYEQSIKRSKIPTTATLS